MYPWKKGAADDRIVTPLSARNREVAMGSNDEQSRRREAGPQLRRQHGDAADVRDRKRQRVDVVAGHPQVVDERAAARQDRRVRVPDALGRRGGAGRVVDPGDVGRVMAVVRRLRRGLALGEGERVRGRGGRDVADQDPRGVPASSRRAIASWSNPRHRAGTMNRSGRTWLVIAPTSASRRIGRIGFCTAWQPGERGHQHHRLDAGGQLPADHGAGDRNPGRGAPPRRFPPAPRTRRRSATGRDRRAA